MLVLASGRSTWMHGVSLLACYVAIAGAVCVVASRATTTGAQLAASAAHATDSLGLPSAAAWQRVDPPGKLSLHGSGSEHTLVPPTQHS